MSTYLEIDDDENDDDGGDQVQKVWSILPVESLLEAIELVWLGEQKVEEGNDGSLELSSLVGSNGDWGEGLPEDGLADVGSNEKRDTRSESISLLEELVKHEDHESSKEKLSNDEN